MHSTTVLVLLIAAVPCFCQRPFYAGRRPIGFPEVNTNSIDNRFSGDLPAALNGDVAYAKRLDQLPPDQRPIWYLNPEQYKDQLNNPQTYPLRPSVFNENSG